MKSIIYKGEEIIYVITRKKVKNINMRVKKDNIVYISVNNRISVKLIEQFILSNAEWILESFKHLNETNNKLNYKYVDGELVRYLGKNLIVRIHNSNENKVEQDDCYLDIYLKDVENVNKKMKIIEKWMLNRCEQICNNLSLKIYEQLKIFKLVYPTIKMRKMTARWGSCQPNTGIITFNKSLIHYHPKWIEYIVLHEFSHLVYADHSKRFYALINTIMPDYKERKQLIKLS